jgi:hypothetical protein
MFVGRCPAPCAATGTNKGSGNKTTLFLFLAIEIYEETYNCMLTKAVREAESAHVQFVYSSVYVFSQV